MLLYVAVVRAGVSEWARLASPPWLCDGRRSPPWPGSGSGQCRHAGGRRRRRTRPAGMPRSIATNTTVDLEGLLDFVRPRHHMVLITQRADGRPQASPVTGGVDDAGRIVISTYPERAKTRQRRSAPAGQRPGAVRRVRRRVGAGRR